MNTLKKYSHWLFLVVFLLIGSLFFNYLKNNFEQKENEARRLKLEYQHNRSIAQFESSVNKFAGLVSGMHSYMNMSPELPSAENFQEFVNNQYSDINLQDSIVVSFIDTTHVFKQSFSRTVMDPAKLVGQSVSILRNKEAIQRLNNLMLHDSLQMLPPLNLIEGWVGLPIDFRVRRDSKTIGYVAPIVSLHSILDAIYKDDEDKEFAHHFSTQDGFDFDRERTYDNNPVYNKKTDSEYYKNFNIEPSKFMYSTNTYYGFGITIGTAYKEAYTGNIGFTKLLLFWYINIALLAFIVVFQMHRFRKLNFKLFKRNKLLRSNKKEIDDKNQELQKLNNTQNKFFSIIGHDIKQPLNAIEGLLGLLQNEEIKDPDLVDIVKGLTKSTKNTTSLLNNLLRWARSQTGDLKYLPVQLDLNNIVEAALETLHFQAKEKSIKIINQTPGKILYRGDRDMLSTIFRNLLSNAVKFTNPGGTIEIETEKRKDSIVFIVKDSGIGMTPEEVDSLFKLDKQISTVGTSGEMGTGLGLILCSDFTNKHGGHIEVESEIDKGTQFTVVLPI